MNMIYINETAIVGQKFTYNDPNTEWTCVGYAANDTFLIVGSSFDSTNNRSIVRTFKLQDVKFHGQLPSPKVS